MVYFTGDIHRDVNRVIQDIEKYSITKDDIIVLLGDAGLNFFGDERDSLSKKLLNAQGVTIFCVHGNHEMRPESLPTYQEKEWHGGIVYKEANYPSLLFGKDGEIFDLDGYTALVIGGAYSVDKPYRLQHGLPWFADEQLSDEIKRRVEANLTAHAWMVDLVLTHTCPQRYIPAEMFLPGLDQSMVDRSTERWLGDIEQKLYYGYWYCGHWHTDKRIDQMHFMMYSYETLPQLEECTFEVDGQLLSDVLAWCKENGTTLDLLTRTFFRFCVDPKNRKTVKQWVSGWKESQKERGDGGN